MKATIGDWSKLKAKCYWHGAATDIQDEVSHLDENSVKFGNKEIYCVLAKFLVLIVEHTEDHFKSQQRGCQTFQFWDSGPIMKRSAKLKMTNLWSQCAKKFSQPILLFLLGWWSWHADFLSKKGCVWYFAHDKRRISPNELRRHNVKISAWLLPEHHLW